MVYPVSPTGDNYSNIDVITFNFEDNPNYVADQTVYAPYPDTFDEEEGHSNATFEGTLNIPIANNDSKTYPTGFTKLMEAAFGKASLPATESAGRTPTFSNHADALYGISNDEADEFVLGC